MCLLNCTGNLSDFNSTSKATGCDPTSESLSPGKIFMAFAYCVILLVSLVGNLTIITIVTRNKQMWSPTNFLIANVAFSDLLMSTFAIPRELVEIFVGPRRWLLNGPAGLMLCKSVYFFQDISTAVSLQSLVVISIYRYRGVVFPFRPPIITSKVCKVLIPVIWIVAMCMHGPYFYTVRLEMQDNKGYCTFSWAPNFDERRAQERYFVFLSVTLIFLPLVLVITLYTLIFLELKTRKVNDNEAQSVRQQRQKENAAITKRISIIILLFVFCMTPAIVLGLVYYFAWNWQLPCGMNTLFSAAKFILYSNASLNPCVYIILSERYRQEFKEVASCLYPSRPDRNPNIDVAMNVL